MSEELYSTVIDKSEQELMQISCRKKTGKFELLAEVTSELLKSTEPQISVQNICYRAMEYLNCHVFFNYLAEEGKNKLYLNAYAGIPEAEANKIHELEYGTAVCGCVARDGVRIVAEHIPSVPDVRTDLVKSYGVKAYAAHPLLSKGGRIIGTLSFGTRDREVFDEEELSLMKAVTDQVAIAMVRMKDEKIIAESEERFATAFKSNPNTLILSRIDDGTIIEVNDSCVDLLGYTREELIGKNSLSFDFFVNSNERSKIIKTIRNKKRIRELEITVKSKSDEPRIVLLSSDLLRMNQGDMLLTSLQDITEKRKVEQKLLNTMKELERSNRDLEQFAFIASHDLQEPVRLMSSFAQLLERKVKDKIDGDAKSYLSFIFNSSLKMQSLIKDLLTYSRLGSKPRDFRSTDCNVILSAALSNLETLIKDNKAIITSSYLPNVYGDSTQIMELFQNLIINGIKFRGNNSPEIDINCVRKNDEWQFSFSDNGIGIEQEYYEKIFLIFRRLHTHEKYPGTGIGLTICKRIVETHGGRIWVESDEGKGTVFYFTLPFYK